MNTVTDTITTIKENFMAEQEISVAEAAHRLGVAISYLYSLVWAGKLPARKVNRQWRVSAEAVESRQKARSE
jgi:excisionase family DNA binding protein